MYKYLYICVSIYMHICIYMYIYHTHNTFQMVAAHLLDGVGERSEPFLGR